VNDPYRTFDAKKGPLYKDLMKTVAAARNISQPEFGGFMWKQGAADQTREDDGLSGGRVLQSKNPLTQRSCGL
jgi:hypothetical protein